MAYFPAKEKGWSLIRRADDVGCQTCICQNYFQKMRGFLRFYFNLVFKNLAVLPPNCNPRQSIRAFHPQLSQQSQFVIFMYLIPKQNHMYLTYLCIFIQKKRKKKENKIFFLQ